ncbi:unnamed protein product, partial [Notodromas monacha]
MATPVMEKTEMVFIDKAFVLENLPWDPLILALENALRIFSDTKSNTDTEEQVLQPSIFCSRWLGVMPAAITTPDKDILATKLVTVYPENGAKSLPSHHAIIVLFDCTSGSIKAVLDGEVITEKRTAAVSAMAAKYLASTSRTVLAVLGSGVQGKAHIEAFLHLFKDIKQVRIWNHRAEGAENLAGKMRVLYPDVEIVACESVELAVSSANMIVTATSSKTPILHHSHVQPGTFIAAVGAPRKDWREMSPELVAKSVLIVDSVDAATVEAGDIVCT